LTLINGLAAMLEAGEFGKTTAAQRKYLGRISSTSERLMTIVDGLLTVNRSQHQRLSLRLQPMMISALIRDVVEELDAQLKARDTRVRLQITRKVPPVIADKACMHQILYNLLDNAIKYSPAKTIVSVKVSLRDEKLVIQISDQGIGIKPSELEKLFERFGNRAQPVAEQAGSSGLGLYIVKSLVELQGGNITATTLTRGSCFTVSLPVAEQLALFINS
jgi:signal transduction histidine kinase